MFKRSSAKKYKTESACSKAEAEAYARLKAAYVSDALRDMCLPDYSCNDFSDINELVKTEQGQSTTVKIVGQQNTHYSSE